MPGKNNASAVNVSWKVQLVYIQEQSCLFNQACFFFFLHLLDIKKSTAGQTEFAWEDLKEKNSC